MTGPQVTVKSGKIQGYESRNRNGRKIYNFLGIPYAKAPLGKLRFQPPEPVDQWTGIFDATKSGNQCLQADAFHSPGKKVIHGNEDCLNLNVFCNDLPNESNRLTPVMVFIHGGGFDSGGNNIDIYGPEFLLKEDVVLVVFNYRLGIFGFISSEDPTLELYGNQGIKDQVLALKWVQENIKSFNGDPNNVTLFGISAGGCSVHYHVLSPTSKGLFQKAIVMSGSALAQWAETTPNLKIIGKTLKPQGASDREILDSLMMMSADEILQVQEKISTTSHIWTLNVEVPNPSQFLTQSAIEIASSGNFNKVPVMIGYCEQEGILGALKTNTKEIDANVLAMFIPWSILEPVEPQEKQDIIDFVEKTYTQTNEGFEQIFADSCFIYGMIAAIKYHFKFGQNPIYVYRSSVDSNRNWLKFYLGLMHRKGCAHADDLGFLFNLKHVPKIEKGSIEDITVKRYVKLWTNFAKTGNPTLAEADSDFKINWPKIETSDVENIPILDIGAELSILKGLPEAKRINGWLEIFRKNKNTAKYFNDP